MRTHEIAGMEVHIPSLIVSVAGVVVAVAVAPDVFVGMPAPSDPQNPAEAWAAVGQMMVWLTVLIAPLWVLTLYLSIKEEGWGMTDRVTAGKGEEV